MSKKAPHQQKSIMGENGSPINPSEVMMFFCGNISTYFFKKGDNLLDIHRI